MPTLDQIKQTQWFKDRPKLIKELICQLPYAATVRIKKTSQIAYVYSWNENGTVTVVVTEEDNPHMVNALPGNYAVFGLTPEDLEFIQENPDLYLGDEDDEQEEL